MSAAAAEPGAAAALDLLARLRIAPRGREAEALEAALAAPGPAVVGFLNAHALNLCWRDAPARAAFGGVDILLRDGAGVEIALLLLGREPGGNLNGTDLIPDLLARSGARVALYGAQPGVAARAADRLREGGVEVCAARHGFHRREAYRAALERDRPDILVLGFGMPLQEALAAELAAAPHAPRLIVCGGAVLDFLAGEAQRAPRWMRRARLEWLHRLALEPRRLAGRYLLGAPLFLWRAARMALAARVAATEAPRIMPPIRG